MAGKIPGTGKAKILDGVKDSLKKMITDYLDGKTPGSAEDVARRLADAQVDAMIDSLRANGHGLPTNLDQNTLRKAVMGGMLGAVTNALRIRGG